MKTSEQTARYQERGFTRDQAEVIAMMHAAAGTLFRDFPESFLLFGGATLLMFYESVRLSADLDLLERSEERPTPNAIQARWSMDLPLWPRPSMWGLSTSRFPVTAK